MRHALWWSLAFGGASLVCHGASAQEVISPDSPAAKDAKARFDEGLRRYQVQDFEGARVAFQQAYSVLHAVDILYNLALSELRSNRPVEALKHLQEYLADKRLSEEERAKAGKFLAEAHAKTGHVFVDAPAGAVLFLDDVALERKAPVKDPLTVSVGKHVVSIRLEGQTQTIEVSANAGQSVTVRFAKSGGRAPEVLEGEQAPLNGETSAAKPEEPKPETREAWSTAKLATVIGLGVGAAGAVVLGVVMVSAAKSNDSDALDVVHNNAGLDCRQPNSANMDVCNKLADFKSSYDTHRTLSTVSFVGAGLLGAGAVAAALFWPNASNEKSSGGAKSATVTPVIGPGGASLVLGGRF